jgi:Dolichyl-phosphate-mannose-protein mannosyltransferase
VNQGSSSDVISSAPRAVVRLSLVRAVPAWAWLIALVAVSAGVRLVLARGMVAPWIMVDELIYSELAKSLASSGHLLVRGHETGTSFGLVYPLLISPAWKAFSAVPQAYATAKVLNCYLMSLAAVPAYLIARRLVGQWLALLAAALSVAIPSMVYTGTLMTENAFYPLFLLAVLALVAYLEQPTLPRVVGVIAATGLAFETRTQAVALLPAILVAPALLSLYDRRGLRGLRDHGWLYGIGGSLVVLVLAVQAARGRSPLGLLGVYGSAGKDHYAVSDVARWLLYHVAELDLYVAVIPFAAFIALAMVGRRLPRPHRAFLAASIPVCASLLLVVAAFATHPDVARIEERNTFYLAPLLLIALVAWIDVGAPRPVLAAGVAVATAVALPGLIPYSSVINVSAVSDTFALLPLWWLQDHVVSLRHLPTLVVAASVLAGVLFLLVPRRFVLALPVLVFLLFAAELVPIEWGAHGVRQTSTRSLLAGVGNGRRDWIDHVVGAHANVLALWSGATSPLTIWENEFFNRSVGTVYDLNGRLPGNFPENQALPNRSSGLLSATDGRPLRDRYVLTDSSVSLRGRPVAGEPGNGMVLLRVGGPLRLQSFVSGLYPADTWSGKMVSYTRFDCSGGILSVTLGSDPALFSQPQDVVARSGGHVVGRVSIPPMRTGALTVPLVPEARRCKVRFVVERTAVPAVVSGGRNPDPRELGARFLRFDFRPR